MFGYIYLTTNLINGKKYIGKHESSVFEFDNYKGSGKAIKQAFKKYGFENFKCELIPEINNVKPVCDSLSELNAAEIYYIDYYNCVNSPLYYNLKDGGDGGDTMSCLTAGELKRRNNKISAANKKLIWISNTRLKKTIKIYAEAFSEYQKEGWIRGNKFKKAPNTQTEKYLLRNAAQRKTYPQEILDKVVLDYQQGLSCSECSSKYGINELWIRKYLKSIDVYEVRGNAFYMQQTKHRDRVISRLAETKKANPSVITRTQQWNDNIRAAVRKSKGRGVYCEDLDLTFNSIAEANEFLGKKSSCDNIGACCRKYAAGKINAKAFGYHWRYIEEGQ